MARRKQAGRMAPHLLRPPAKRKASTTTVIVHDEPYNISGVQSIISDLRCIFCLGWDKGEMSRLVCNAPVHRCEFRAYLCTSHSRDPRFKSYCATCHQPASVVPDPTATALLKHTALVECTSTRCPELVSMDDMETHLLTECAFNMVTCDKPGCSLR